MGSFEAQRNMCISSDKLSVDKVMYANTSEPLKVTFQASAV